MRPSRQATDRRQEKEMEEKTREDMITMVTDSGESVDFMCWKKQGSMQGVYLLVTDAPEGIGRRVLYFKGYIRSRTPRPCMSLWKTTANWTPLKGVFEELLSDADVDLEK